ncbi:MAG: glycosyltransferase, partial [Gaiellaceae bacterium]
HRARPRVSVLMPVRDAARYVEDALASILEQTVSDLEVVVVDDGSRDATHAILARCAAADRRVRLVTQERAGVVVASARAQLLARASVLARMDADDIALPDRLECQLDRLSVGDIGACGGQVEFFPDAEVRGGMRRYETWLNTLTSPELAARDVFVECPIAHPTLMVRREALEAAGGWRGCAWPEDYDIMLRLYRAGVGFCSVDQPVLRWREHGRRLTRTDERYTQAAFVRCKVHHLRAHLGARAGSVVVFGCGPVGKAFARELQRQGSRVAAFLEVDPRKIGKTVHGAPVHAMDDAATLVELPAVGAVAGAEPRDQVRGAAGRCGWTEGADFFAVA